MQKICASYVLDYIFSKFLLDFISWFVSVSQLETHTERDTRTGLAVAAIRLKVCPSLSQCVQGGAVAVIVVPTLGVDGVRVYSIFTGD